MDETRSPRSEERPFASGRREVTAHDPVTGTPAPAPEETRQKPLHEESPDEIAQDIRRTRAEMSETVDALERRLSPHRLKQEAKHTVHETIDEVRERFDPQRIAKRTGNNMLDAVKEHPIPALMAGLSIGYLLMKAGQNGGRDYDYDGDAAYRYPYGRRGYYGEREYNPQGRYRAGRSTYDPDYYAGRSSGPEAEYEYDPAYTSSDDRSMRDRTTEIKDRTSETVGAMQERASDFAHQAQEGAQELGHQVRRRSSRAQRDLESFVYENPLAAGAIALGVGALVGGFIPSTRKEDELMGETRDKVIHQAEETAQQTMGRAKQAARETVEQAKQSAKRIVDETGEAAQEVKETAKAEAQHVKTTAKESAKGAGDEAGHQAKEQRNTGTR